MMFEDWYGLYKRGWGKMIVPDAYSHPAKFSKGLIEKIYDWGQEQGYWDKSSVILDCFGGVGLGGVVAMMKGYNWLGVELEPKFVTMANQNFEHIRELWKGNPPGQATILQGDSRNLREVLGQARVDGIITSSPWEQQIPQQDKGFKMPHDTTGKIKGDYGSTPGQLGNMKEGNFDAVITSPSYVNINPAQSSKGIDLKKQYRTYQNQGGGSSFESFCNIQGKHSEGYGKTEGQIANLPEGSIEAVITSPPYSEIRQDGGSTKEGYGGTTNYTGEPRKTWRTQRDQRNIGNMPEGNIDAILTSPPWENMGTPNHKGQTDSLRGGKFQGGGDKFLSNDYGTTPGQIGKQSGENYWAAVRDVYAECFQVLKPGGIMVVVVKSFIRNKKLVNLPDMTLKLLEHIGFEPLWYIRAWQIRPGPIRTKLTGENTQRIKTDKGFFRRDYEKKNPHNRIDYEIILIVQKPNR